MITRASQGDEAAWTQLVSEHQQAVFRLAWLLTGDANEAEDVAQEAFIRAYQALGRFDSTRPLRPWLLRITSNIAHNRRRAISRYMDAVRRWFQNVPEQVMDDVASEAEKQWEAHTLWQAVQTLRRKDQEIIYLRYFLELSTSETGETLNIASGTVKSRLSRALDRLQTAIEHDFPTLQEERIRE